MFFDTNKFNTHLDSLKPAPEYAKTHIQTPKEINEVLAKHSKEHQLAVQAMVDKTVNSKRNLEKAEADQVITVGAPDSMNAPGFEVWLPFASKQLNISSNPLDYALYITPVMPSDLPNRNGVGFPLRELVKWNRNRGCLAYQTMARMPMHIEHESDDMRQAGGVVVDTAMTKLKGFGSNNIWKMMAVVAIDLTKHDIAKKFDAGTMNTYSMGSMVDSYYCSYCGSDLGDCSHIHADKMDFYELDGKLVYKMVKGVEFFEFSMVADPAYAFAQSDVRLRYGK